MISVYQVSIYCILLFSVVAEIIYKWASLTVLYIFWFHCRLHRGFQSWLHCRLHVFCRVLPELLPFDPQKNRVFSHDVTKMQTTKLSILPRFYFHDALEQLKTNFHTNFRFKRVLGFVIEYAWISKLLRDAAFTWRPRELSCRLKKWLISGNFAI